MHGTVRSMLEGVEGHAVDHVDAQALSVEKVTKTYRCADRPALASVDMSMSPGSLTCLLGPNGAGKTTLVRQIIGLDTPDSGSVSLFGHDIRTNRALAAQMCAYLPQTPFPFSDLLVRDVLRISAHLAGLRPHSPSVAEEVEYWGLGPLMGSAVGRLSGGERRMLGLAATLCRRCPIVILDEPTNDLSAEVRRKLWERLRERRRAGFTQLVITHNLHEAETVAEHVVLLIDGRVQLSGHLSSLWDACEGRRSLVKVGLLATAPEAPRLLEHLARWDPELVDGSVLMRVPAHDALSIVGAVLGAEVEVGLGRGRPTEPRADLPREDR